MSKDTQPPPLPSGLFWESACAQQFGVSRTHLRQLRQKHLTDQRDFQFHGNAVALTPAGLARITALLAGAPVPLNDTQSPAALPVGPAPAPPVVPPGPPPKSLFVVTAVPIHRLDRPQTKLVIARRVPPGFPACTSWDLPKRLAALPKVDDGRERPIRVRDNSHFRPGMVFECVSISDGMWQYAGRLPRRPGKW